LFENFFIDDGRRFMKIFISWSGNASKEIACVLRDWIPSVLQSVETWVSSEDIDKGSRWGLQLSKELEETSFGIICLLHDNVNEPWINFEAGALSKTVDVSRVIPFLINIDSSKMSDPLSQFQAAIYEKEDVRKLIHSINSANENKMPEHKLDKIFDYSWEGLKKEIDDILEEVIKLRNENDTLNEQESKLEGKLPSDIDIDNIAFEENVTVRGTYKTFVGSQTVIRDWKHDTSWKNLFILVSPYLLRWYNEDIIQTQIASTLLNKEATEKHHNEIVDKDILQSIKVQFLALDLIQIDTLNTTGGSTGLFWTLTKKGKIVMLNERSVKKRDLSNIVPKRGGLLKDILRYRKNSYFEKEKGD
jgi:hypothetical protein